jgi:hypothetical protein
VAAICQDLLTDPFRPKVVNVPARGPTGNPVSKTFSYPIFVSEDELTLIIKSLLMAGAAHLQKAQTALETEALDACYHYLGISETTQALAERISGMDGMRKYCADEKQQEKV